MLMYIIGVAGVIGIALAWNRLRVKRCQHCVLIFSRYPSPGTTKTRLIPAIGPEAAAYCQTLMTEHILGKLGSYCQHENGNVLIEVQYKGGTPEQMEFWLGRKRSCIPTLTWMEQSEGDLGEKMMSAVKNKFLQGMESVVVVGSDIPDISDSDIEEAFYKLKTSADMVLGKAQDGGYYLVGFNKSAVRYLDNIFIDMKWGTSEVFQTQTQRAREVGAELDVLSRTLSDVDTAEDLDIFEKALQISRTALTLGDWSIVIPVLNEARRITDTLQTILDNSTNIHGLREIIVSDGGSTDETVNIVEKFAETCQVTVKVVRSSPGRGFQLQTGVSEATGSHVLLVHGDCIVPEGYDQSAMRCLTKPGIVAGAYKFGLDVVHKPSTTDLSKEEKKFRAQMKWLSGSVQFRTRRFELPYGDQGMFLSKKSYEAVGGFPKVYLMEDFILTEKLQKIGHICLAEDCGPIIISSRRWQKLGFMRVTAVNFSIVLLYKLGVHPDTLARWYYGDKLPKK